MKSLKNHGSLRGRSPDRNPSMNHATLRASSDDHGYRFWIFEPSSPLPAMGQVLILLTGIDVADNDQRNVNLFLSHVESLLIAILRNLVQPFVILARKAALLFWRSSSVLMDYMVAWIVPTPHAHKAGGGKTGKLCHFLVGHHASRAQNPTTSSCETVQYSLPGTVCSFADTHTPGSSLASLYVEREHLPPEPQKIATF
jgi:hypothetical protein